MTGYDYKGAEILITDWLLGNPIKNNKIHAKAAGFYRVFHLLTYDDQLEGALRVPLNSNFPASVCFINNRSNYRGCSYSKSFSTRTAFLRDYFLKNAEKLGIKFYEVPFYAFDEADINLHECKVLDYNIESHDVILSTKVDNLYIHYKNIPIHKGDVEWKFVNKEISSLAQIVNG
jgi:hypothetical protein